jgi:hypothetical protein
MVLLVGLFSVLAIFRFGNDVTLFSLEISHKIPRESNKVQMSTHQGEKSPDTVQHIKAPKWQTLGRKREKIVI